MSSKIYELQQEIRKLLKEKNGIMLAHNYQRDEIQEMADVTGDSLALSQIAAKTDAEVIVFCGVHFMAESASKWTPQKTITSASVFAAIWLNARESPVTSAISCISSL